MTKKQKKQKEKIVLPQETYSMYKFGKPHTPNGCKSVTLERLIQSFEKSPWLKIFIATRFYPSLIISEWISSSAGLNAEFEIKQGAIVSGRMSEILCKKYSRKNERDVI